MNTIYQKIQELEIVNGYSKHDQLVHGILNAIDDKIVTQGNMLPSVNNMVRELGFSSKTIVKAYKELKDRGLVESKNRLGYYIINEATEQTARVALLLYAFHPFQEVFYNAFRSALGENIHVEIFFHHNNIEVFETILGNIKGKYGMYVIAPIPHINTKKLLGDIDENKLLLVDRYESVGSSISHVTQEFENATYKALVALAPKISQYERMTLYFRPNSDYPIEVKRAFQRFLKDFNIQGTIETSYIEGQVQKGSVYFTIGDSDLWRILKDCKVQGIKIGEEVGILSNNDSPVKEIICDGITTLSTDFKKMGQEAADFVLNRVPIQKTTPTVLIRRNSL